MMSQLSIFVFVLLSFGDIVLTYFWSQKCIKFRPKLNATPEKFEANKFVCMCWTNFGYKRGSVVSGLVLICVQAILINIHWALYWIIIVILVFANYNHVSNFITLDKKMRKRKKN